MEGVSERVVEIELLSAVVQVAMKRPCKVARRVGMRATRENRIFGYCGTGAMCRAIGAMAQRRGCDVVVAAADVGGGEAVVPAGGSGGGVSAGVELPRDIAVVGGGVRALRGGFGARGEVGVWREFHIGCMRSC